MHEKSFCSLIELILVLDSLWTFGLDLSPFILKSCWNFLQRHVDQRGALERSSAATHIWCRLDRLDSLHLQTPYWMSAKDAVAHCQQRTEGWARSSLISRLSLTRQTGYSMSPLAKLYFKIKNTLNYWHMQEWELYSSELLNMNLVYNSWVFFSCLDLLSLFSPCSLWSLWSLWTLWSLWSLWSLRSFWSLWSLRSFWSRFSFLSPLKHRC